MTAPTALYAATSCLVCSRPVRWVATATGGRLPLDPAPHPAGNVVPIYAPGRRRPLARVLPSPVPDRDAWREHYCDERHRQER